MYSRYRLALLLVVACAVVICGCSRYGGKVIAEVNGRTLRSEEVEARATNIAALFLHKTGKIDQLEKIKETFRKGYPQIWIEDRVLEAAAKAEGVEVPADMVEKCRTSALHNFKVKGDNGYEDLMKLSGFTRELWEDQVLCSARRLVMKSHWAQAEPANLPTNYADKVLADIARWNANMAKTNALQYAKATNVWEKLKAGADFVKTARANTEAQDEIEDDCEWLTVDDKFLADDQALLAQIKAMKPGEFSPPVDGDGGIMIARLNFVEDDGSYNVSRIFFRKGNVMTPAPKREILAAAVEKHTEDLFRRRLKELVNKATGGTKEKDNESN